MKPFSSYKYPSIGLQVFTKLPMIGTVKTRMQPIYPAEFSLALHKQLVGYCVSHWIDSQVCPMGLWLAGDANIFETIFPQFSALPIRQQQGINLGERLFSASNTLLNGEHEGVLLVGTDCPFIDSEYLANACYYLQKNDVVIGPAIDGGYVLLGIKKPYRDLFSEIDWGTGLVFQQTREKIKALNLSCHCLPELSDIDVPDDLPLLMDIKYFSPLLAQNLTTTN